MEPNTKQLPIRRVNVLNYFEDPQFVLFSSDENVPAIIVPHSKISSTGSLDNITSATLLVDPLTQKPRFVSLGAN